MADRNDVLLVFGQRVPAPNAAWGLACVDGGFGRRWRERGGGFPAQGPGGRSSLTNSPLLRRSSWPRPGGRWAPSVSEGDPEASRLIFTRGGGRKRAPSSIPRPEQGRPGGRWAPALARAISEASRLIFHGPEPGERPADDNQAVMRGQPPTPTNAGTGPTWPAASSLPIIMPIIAGGERTRARPSPRRSEHGRGRGPLLQLGLAPAKRSDGTPHGPHAWTGTWSWHRPLRRNSDRRPVAIAHPRPRLLTETGVSSGGSLAPPPRARRSPRPSSAPPIRLVFQFPASITSVVDAPRLRQLGCQPDPVPSGRRRGFPSPGPGP